MIDSENTGDTTADSVSIILLIAGSNFGVDKSGVGLLCCVLLCCAEDYINGNV